MGNGLAREATWGRQKYFAVRSLRPCATRTGRHGHPCMAVIRDDPIGSDDAIVHEYPLFGFIKRVPDADAATFLFFDRPRWSGDIDRHTQRARQQHHHLRWIAYW